MTRPQELIIEAIQFEIQKHKEGLGYTKEDIRAFEFMIEKITQIANGNSYDINPAAYFEIKDTAIGIIKTSSDK